MIRAPFALEKMRYDAATGMVVYRSKMHATLKRKFQLVTGARWRLAGALEHTGRENSLESTRALGFPNECAQSGLCQTVLRALIASLAASQPVATQPVPESR